VQRRGARGRSMRVALVLRLAVAVFFCIPAAGNGAGEPPDGFRRCLECHSGIERLDERHDFECGVCHLHAEERAAFRLASHEAVIRNPSDPSHADASCGGCHREEIARLRRSLHGTLAGIINQTRFLWGAQSAAEPPVYGMGGGLRPIPEPQEGGYAGGDPSALVDDFLRRRCLGCHIGTQGPSGYGLHRGTGCAACHVPHDASGRYKGDDPVLDRGRTGYAARHVFERPIPNERCLRCHRRNHTGADFEGLFERDLSRVYRPHGFGDPLAVNSAEPGYHQLAKDVHAERGMLCVDCHASQEVMGDGGVYASQRVSPGRGCEDCHGGWEEEAPPGGKPEGVKRFEASRGIRENEDRATPAHENQEAAEPDRRRVFDGKGGGGRRDLPLFDRTVPAHGVSGHRRVRCSACHAQWSFQDYGLSVVRLDLLSGDDWRGLTAQGDPDLQDVLEAHLAQRGGTSRPESLDRLSGRVRPGIWLTGWRFRRWEWLPLGVDHEGRICVMRPRHQYLVSYVDRSGQVQLDSVLPRRGDGSGRGWAFMPYIPHTIGPVGRPCEACHLNRVSAGLGVEADPTIDTVLTKVSEPALKCFRLLDLREIEALMNPPEEWGGIRLRALGCGQDLLAPTNSSGPSEEGGR